MKFSDNNRPGIYKIVNSVTGKCYVGSAVNIRLRFNGHRKLLYKNKHHNQKLQFSWNKHGSENFTFFVLEYVENKDHLIMREQHWINYFDAVNVGYNLVPIAGSQLGMKHSAATLAKMSAAAKGRIKSPETRALISAAHKGRKFSDEHRRKLSERVITEETRKKQSAFRVGKKLSERTKEKMRVAQKGRKHSLETRSKMSAWQIGKKHSQETIAKIAAKATGRKQSEASKEKKRIASTGRRFTARMFRSNAMDICTKKPPDRRFKKNKIGV